MFCKYCSFGSQFTHDMVDHLIDGHPEKVKQYTRAQLTEHIALFTRAMGTPIEYAHVVQPVQNDDIVDDMITTAAVIGTAEVIESIIDTPSYSAPDPEPDVFVGNGGDSGGGGSSDNW